MLFTYKDRKVDRFEHTDGISFISTAKVTDSRDPYETGICYKPWGQRVIVVQTYSSIEDAKIGHQRYVELMLSSQLPKEPPTDAGTNIWAETLRASCEEDENES
jgi:hypothetical protein